MTDRISSSFTLYNNPEFLREGFALQDFLSPDRIVIGSNLESLYIESKLLKLYKAFDSEIIVTNLNTAEFIKYLSNTLLSTLISYSNEMSIIADTIGGISIKTAFDTLHKDFRINNSAIKSYIYPGYGYGGYCLPKDTMALVSLSRNYGYNPNILSGNISVNKKITDHVVQKISSFINKDANIGILGLSFKPGSDDVRETKTYDLIKKMTDIGFSNIVCHDPLAIEKFKLLYDDLKVSYINSLQELISNSLVLIIATPWPEYLRYLKSGEASEKIIFDLRFSVYDFTKEGNHE